MLSIINILTRRLFFSALSLVLLISGCSKEVIKFKCAPIFEVSINERQSINAYIVKQGDSLYKISKLYDIDVDLLKKVNNLDSSCQLNTGSLLYIPSVDNSYEESIVTNSTNIRKIENPISKTNTNIKILWEWPCDGIIKEYFNLKNRGIDISSTIGEPVFAAASGKVVYSGGGVRGLGKLLILSHDQGFITAYAHNSRLFVYNGQEVTKGYKIAEIGDSDSDYPKLHFEIRKNGLPVDPLNYLPKK
ncbi:lipoprotein NlpD [Candidatus Kinetoplastibacterium galatii TCC219]|uniref:Lipoprotein NlpD n=2 Tax=Candidatus Kinetoplastidibacterium galati TaxID=994695 RepID=M1L8Q9_9PROT|nr:lipoprotein NlpD [Candidatus Kinetoplastibacterium galatii TCC219]